MMIVRKHNILDVNPNSYIVHQTNCVVKHGKGLSKQIFDRWPSSNIYKSRQTPSQGGTFIISHELPFIVNVMGQLKPGKPRYGDNSEYRKRIFRMALNSFVSYLDMNSISLDVNIPWGIGCGLAGGNWNDYLDILLDVENSQLVERSWIINKI